MYANCALSENITQKFCAPLITLKENVGDPGGLFPTNTNDKLFNKSM